MTGKFVWQGWIVALVWLTLSAGANATYTFSIVPQQSATKTALIWGPVLKYLKARTGEDFRLVTARNIPAFEQNLREGRADFSYMNPYHYTVFHETQGYRALVRARDRVIKGIVVVAKDSPLRDIRELAGQTLVFPAPAAFAASLLPRGTFAQRDIAITPKYVGSHDSVYLNVARGFYPAGGGIMRTLNNMPPKVRDQLRVLWISPGYTPHAVAVHPRVSAKLAEAVRQALQELDANEAGRALLKRLRIKGFMAANNADWDDVRALNLKALQADPGGSQS